MKKDKNPSDITDKFAKEFIKGLNKGAKESSKRMERFEKIYNKEKSKWPDNMGQKQRFEIPKSSHTKLDQCITNSQEIAREYCQTDGLTEKYFKKQTAATSHQHSQESR